MSDVKLTTEPGLTQRFTDQEVKDLKKYGTFKTAEITRGTYIFMEKKDFDPEGVADSKVLVDLSKVYDISNVNGSFYWLPDVDDGIVLFEHPCFRSRHHKYYEDSSGDITADFPAGTPQGASSCILMSQDEPFDLFTEKGFGGLSMRVKRGPGDPIDKYYYLADMNDKVQSLRKI